MGRPLFLYFAKKNLMVEETELDEPKVDKTVVDEIAVDEPGPHHYYGSLICIG